MKNGWKSVGIAFLAIASTAATARAGDERLSPELKSSSSINHAIDHAARALEVIVQYRVAPTEAHHQRVRNLGGNLISRMDYIKAGHYTVPASAVKTLAGDPDIAYITPN